ncbi:MAG: hypothetical protein CMJ78_17285 [Planctomycetaceae bacterium]|nr:hypothetical protein [Planctomycetaceae bacterium]
MAVLRGALIIVVLVLACLEGALLDLSKWTFKKPPAGRFTARQMAIQLLIVLFVTLMLSLFLNRPSHPLTNKLTGVKT